MPSSTVASVLHVDTAPLLTPTLGYLNKPPPASPKYTPWVLASIINYRWDCHMAAGLLPRIPPGPNATYLRDNALAAFYTYYRNIHVSLVSEAASHGIQLPPFPPCPENWQEEATTEELTAALEPLLSAEAKAIMRFTSRMLADAGAEQLGWAEALAAYAVVSEAYEEAMAELGAGNEWIVAEGMGAWNGGVRGELERLRGEGWEEERVREAAAEHVGLLYAFLKAEGF